MSKAYFEGQDFSTTEKNNAPIGTGKYKIVKNDEKIVLNKNENYSRDELTLETITIEKYESLGELYNAFKLGKIDLITTNNTSIENYIGTIGYNKQEVDGREFDYLALNTQIHDKSIFRRQPQQYCFHQSVPPAFYTLHRL